MSNVFSRDYPILFSHCDPAGIAYFPRLFDLLHTAMEDWFTYGLDKKFSEFVVIDRLGVPTVNTQVDFLSPAHFGDMLKIELSILKLGSSSIQLAINASVQSKPTFRAKHTICVFDNSSLRAVPIPEYLRERMQAYVAAS